MHSLSILVGSGSRSHDLFGAAMTSFVTWFSVSNVNDEKEKSAGGMVNVGGYAFSVDDWMSCTFFVKNADISVALSMCIHSLKANVPLSIIQLSHTMCAFSPLNPRYWTILTHIAYVVNLSICPLHLTLSQWALQVDYNAHDVAPFLLRASYVD